VGNLVLTHAEEPGVPYQFVPKGTYDVIVTNTDGGVAKLPNAFTVK
jgi:hypothetical protein